MLFGNTFASNFGRLELFVVEMRASIMHGDIYNNVPYNSHNDELANKNKSNNLPLLPNPLDEEI